MTYIIVVKDHMIENERLSYYQFGYPVGSAEEARSLIYAREPEGVATILGHIDEESHTYLYYETSLETGEVVRELLVKRITEI